MKSKKSSMTCDKFKASVATWWRRWSLLWYIFLLITGYCFLSPDNCQNAISWLAERSWMPAGNDLVALIPFARKVIPPLIIIWAIMFIIGLFFSWTRNLFWKCVIYIILGSVIWFLPCQLENFTRYFDAFYASFVLILAAGWLASLFYGLAHSGGAKALVLVIFVIIGSLLYEWLASLGAFQFHGERWIRPEQIIDCVFGVIDKQKDIQDVTSVSHGLAVASYYLFHALLAFFFGYIIIGFVSKAAVNTILLRFLRSPDSIFWGVNTEALYLARDLKKHGEKCVFVVSDFSSVDTGMLDQLSAEDFLWVPNGRGSLRMVAQPVKKHFFLSQSGSQNVEWATQLAEFVNNQPEVYIRIDDDADDSWLFRWADDKDIQGKLNIHIVRETSLVADVLLSDHPSLLAPCVECKNGKVTKVSEKGDSIFRLLQIGFGSQGQMLFNRTLSDVQAPGLLFNAVLIDNRREAFDLYDVRCPDVKREYCLRFVNMDVRTKTFFDWLEKEISKVEYTRIFISTDNDDLNLSVAEFIVKYYMEKGDMKRLKNLSKVLFVRVRYPENYANLKSLEEGKALDFTHFGADKTVYSYDNVVNLDIDIVAKKSNARWSKGLDENIKWAQTSFFNRESSRASAMGMKNLLRLSAVEKTILSEEEWKSMLKGNSNLLKNLCDAEHLRWIAFHYVRGIRAWDPETEPSIMNNVFESANNKIEALLKESKNDKLKLKDKKIKESEYKKALFKIQLKANQRIAANRHAALIPTERLFRMDVYLDIKTFDKLGEILSDKLDKNYELFRFYSKELEKHWNYLIKEKNIQYPEEKDFLCNKNLLALNRCVFALKNLGECIESLLIVPSDTVADLKKLLMDFSEKVKDEYECHCEEEINRELRQLSENITDKVKSIRIWNKIFRRGITYEMDSICKKANDIVKDLDSSEKLKQSFSTLGNMIGNDIDVVKGVSEYLSYFRTIK